MLYAIFDTEGSSGLRKQLWPPITYWFQFGTSMQVACIRMQHLG